MKSRALLLFTLALCSIDAYAQTALATLTGSITDPAGAAVPNVSVAARHLESGTTITGASSATGIFTLTQLPVGKYDFIFGEHDSALESIGLTPHKRTNVTLSAAQILRMDVQLELGRETTVVNVEASLLKTDTSAIVHNVTGSQLQNLPLTPINAFVGRDILQVTQLVPGIRYATQNPMLVNGLPSDQVQYRIEGHVMGNTRPTAVLATMSVQPSVDSVQEVAVQTSNYAAEFGSVSSGLLNFTMRSGTNQYHGSAFDYAVNEALNAYNPGRHTRDRLRRHDWGGTFGGAIRVPKLYNGVNKSFFFFTWERFDQSQVVMSNPAGDPTVPTASYRSGDFSSLPGLSGGRNLVVGARDYKDPLGNSIPAGTLFDPGSFRQVVCNTSVSSDCGANGSLVNYRTPLPGNRIPVIQFDPVAFAILDKYIPQPLGPRSSEVASNYYSPFESNRVTNLPSIKLDHNLSPTTRLSFLYQQTKTSSPLSNFTVPEGFNSTITTGRGAFESQKRYVLNADHTITPTLQLHLSAGWTQFDSSDRAPVTDYNPAEDIGLRGVKLNRNFPRFAATTISTATGVQLGGMNAMGPPVQQSLPERRPSANLSATWIKNSHTLKLGADWRMDVLPATTFTSTAGSFSSSGFSGITSQPAIGTGSIPTGVNNTGFPFADFLLGSVRGFNLAVPVSFRTSKQQWGMYLEDTWRVTRKLTLEYGLRWDLGTYAKEDYGRNATFGPNVANPSAGGHPGALVFEATCKCSVAQVYPYAVGPRLGVAYNWNSKTVIRAGLGVAYSSTANFASVPANTAQSPSLAAGLDFFKMRDGIPSSINPVWPNFDPGSNHLAGRILPTSPAPLLDPNAGRPARTYQWNIGIQREFGRNTAIEVAYVGNRGVWQNAPAMVDLNAVSVEQLARYGFTVGNVDDANLLNQQFPLLSTNQRGILAQRGVFSPYSGFPLTATTLSDGTTQSAATVLQSLRPYPQYSGAINSVSAPLGKSWYDSLQITGTKRYSHGLSVNINYTLSKNLGQSGIPDVFNRDTGKTYVTSNAPQHLRIIFEYQIPRFSSTTPVFGNKWVNHAVAGWGLSAVMRYSSGSFLGRPLSTSPQPISRWLGRGPGLAPLSGGAQLKKNADGSYMNPWSVDWIDYSGKRRSDPLDINCHCFDPEKTVVFNPAAWESVPDAQWAADNGVLPFFRTQRTPQESANLSRNFALGKERRYNLQVRVEFQNIFNRVFLPTPLITNTSFTLVAGQTALQTKSADGRYIGGFGTFGNLRTVIGGSRTGMFVGRFTF